MEIFLPIRPRDRNISFAKALSPVAGEEDS